MLDSDPFTPEGQLWLDQFREHFSQWVDSGEANEALLLQAVDDLTYLLELSPAYAAKVQSISLTAAFNARLTASPNAISALAQIGNVADLLQTDHNTIRNSARVLLNLYLAEAELNCRRQYSGLQALKRVEELVEQAEPYHCV